MSEKKNTPTVKYKDSLVELAGWDNEVKTKQGNVFTVRNFSLQRSYKDEKGEWKQTQSFRKQDLQVIRTLVEKALLDIVGTPETEVE